VHNRKFPKVALVHSHLKKLVLLPSTDTDHLYLTQDDVKNGIKSVGLSESVSVITEGIEFELMTQPTTRQYRQKPIISPIRCKSVTRLTMRYADISAIKYSSRQATYGLRKSHGCITIRIHLVA